MKKLQILELSNNKLLDINKKNFTGLDDKNYDWNVIAPRELSLKHNKSRLRPLETFVDSYLERALNDPLDVLILNYDHTEKLGLSRNIIDQGDLIQATKNTYLDLLLATNKINKSLKYKLTNKSSDLKVIVYQDSVHKYYPAIESSKSAVKTLIESYRKNLLPYFHIENHKDLKRYFMKLNEQIIR